MNILSCIEIDKTKCRNLKTQNFFFLKKYCNVVLTSLGYMRLTRPTQPSALLDFRLFPSFPRTQRQIMYVHMCACSLWASVYIYIYIYIHTNTQLRLWSPYQVLEMIFFLGALYNQLFSNYVCLKVSVIFKIQKLFQHFFFCFNSKSSLDD